MSRKGAAGGSLLALLLLITAVGWVLSQIWLYLVIGAAVALVGWIGFILARTIRASAVARPTNVAIVSPPSTNHYRPLVAVDPKVFDDPLLAEAAAVKVFGAWTRQLPMAPSNVSDLVQSVSLRIRHVGHLATEVATRHVAWRAVPYGGTSAVTAPPMIAEAVNPWITTLDALRRDSHHIGSCEECVGQGQVTCATCGGRLHFTCPECRGEGKAYGYASNGARRLLNCKNCKGKREVKCVSCNKGKTACTRCHGTGHCERWLEIVETTRTEVGCQPKEGSMSGPASDGKPNDLQLDAKLLIDVSGEGALERDRLGNAPADWITENWSSVQPKLADDERVRRQQFRLFEMPRIELTYSIGGSVPSAISFEGLRMLAPPPSIDTQFAARARTVRMARYGAVGVAAAISIAYLIRGSYFWSGSVAALGACVFIVALSVEGFVRQSTLGRRTARQWAVAIGVGAALACGFAFAAEPSARAARRHIAAGRLDLADRELRALGPPTDPAVSPGWAALHLAEAQRSDDVSALARSVAQIPEALPERAQADQRLFAVVSKAATDQIVSGQPETVGALLDQAIPTLQDPAGKALLPQLAELRADAHDNEFARCSKDGCRWRASLEAATASLTPARQQRLAEVRAKVLEALAARPEANGPVLPRLRQLDGIKALADAVAATTGDDAVGIAGRAADEWADDERRRVAVIGAERAVVEELLGAPDDTSSIPRTLAADVSAFWELRAGRCVGLYVVGATPRARVLNDGRHSATTVSLLSQALGHRVEMPDSPRSGTSASITKWHDRGVALAARWRGSDLIELRIGDATP